MKRIDSKKRSMLVSKQNIHEIIGKALGKEKEINEYRRLFEEATKAKLITDYPIHLDFSQAALISDNSVALPVGPHLTSDDMVYIGAAFNRIAKEMS